ncbi:GreA/GreB family elongation factor [Vibrio sp. D431a]|uniref:GreA/GreB family elongation factor n=1 Tax=Vibrio sp. D431a TaxID=2837388 RepID=UPI002556A440|nr:GreA/GreB family elongation factor [Vibrio sp. D431a]MDK9793887.1 GreA/GreB family elongation factor [Vibrio sp. D431a]
MQSEYISREGYDFLNAQIKNLKVQHKDLLDQITLNREQESGDESENSELIRLNAEINSVIKKEQELTEYCSSCVIVDLSKQAKDGRVRFGNTVTVLDLDNDKTNTYQILGEKEADPSKHKLSYKSPLGRYLIGLEVGDECEVPTPSGYKKYEILELKES